MSKLKGDVLTQTGRVILDIEAERLRQVRQEGWSDDHDDEHVNQELARAATCYLDFYCSGDTVEIVDHDDGGQRVHHDWPWEARWWKPKEPRRDLIRAAALIVAEIERIDRGKLRDFTVTADGYFEFGDGPERLQSELTELRTTAANQAETIADLEARVSKWAKRAGKSQGHLFAAQAENERLRNMHDRNVRHLARCKYEDIGHHCGWRVIAEAMAERSKQALQPEPETIKDTA